MAKTAYLVCLDTSNVFLQTPKQINSRYEKLNTGAPLKMTDAGFAYDAMWTIATALNRSEEYFKKMKPSLSIKNFTYMSKAMTEHFKNAINETNFIGVTVSIIKPNSVKFSECFLLLWKPLLVCFCFLFSKDKLKLYLKKQINILIN